MRQRQRIQVHRDLCLLAKAAGDHDLAEQPSLSACSLRDRLRHRAALLQALRVAGHCRNTWDAFTYTCSLMAWYELAVPGLLAAWVLLSLTPEVLSGRVGWPFVDVVAWWWMQADFVWRLKWDILKQMTGAVCSAFVISPLFVGWLDDLFDIRATARARKVKPAMSDEWMPPRPSHLMIYASDSENTVTLKDRRYMKLFITLMQQPTLWERIGLPAPTWTRMLVLVAVVYGGLAYGGLADVLAEPGTKLYIGLAWPRLALRHWRLQLWARDPGAWGLTGIAAVVAIGVAAALTSSAQKRWFNTYMDTLAREMMVSGATRPTRHSEAVATSMASAVHGDVPSTLARLINWGYYLFRFYLGMCGGALLVGWLLFGGNLPAYGLYSYRGYTGYSGHWLVRPPPPICMALHNVSDNGSSSGGGGRGGGTSTTPAAGMEAVLDGLVFTLTPQLLAAVKEVAGQDGGIGGWWRQLQLASNINLLAVRAHRSRGLNGVQAALEAVRAARELSPFLLSAGQVPEKLVQAYESAVRVLHAYPLHHAVTKADAAQYADVHWAIGSSVWSLGLAWEKLSVVPPHFPREPVKSRAGAASASSSAATRSGLRRGQQGAAGRMLGGLSGPMDLTAVDAAHGDAHASPPAPPAPVCDARAVLDRALTGAWHCTAALGEAAAAGSAAASSVTESTQRRATSAANAKTKGASSKMRTAPAAAPAGSSAGRWLAFFVALAVVYMWAFVWPPWTRSPELFINHMAGLVTRGGREVRAPTRKAGRFAAAASSSSGGSRREDATPVAPALKGQKQHTIKQAQKQTQKQQPAKQLQQPQKDANAAAAARAAPTHTVSVASPPAEPAETERSASSSSAQSAAAAAAPASLVRSTSQSSSKQSKKSKSKVPEQAKVAPAKPAAALQPQKPAAPATAAAKDISPAAAAAASDTPSLGTAPSLRDLLPFTADLAANSPQQPDAQSEHLTRLVDEAIAAQHAPPPPPPLAAAAEQPKRSERPSGAAAAADTSRSSYATAALLHSKRSTASKPAASVPDAAGAAAAETPLPRPAVTTSSLFNWNRPVIITSAPPPPLTAAQLRARAQQMPLPTAPPAAATAAAPAPAHATVAAAPAPTPAAAPGPSAGATAAEKAAVPIPVPIPIPIPEPMAGGLPSSRAAPAHQPAHPTGPGSTATSAAAVAAATAAAAVAPPPPPRAPPSSFLGFNPALMHVLGRAHASPAAPASAVPAAASEAADSAAARAPGGTRTFQLYDTAGLDAAKCIRCRGGMREVVYLHKNNTVAHRAFCRACSAADGRAVGEPCPLCNQTVERVLSMF
ncbi:hypothetical protein HXX76_005251 [Chlamydomonas incerta]|uniref:Uncharacterized protein n=1 Tax=Chlamydomonas incerta TaxID=51695 RepID=A0A835THA5_CHLIN|nr:hypothetical protein HXX76_005251 [Chlamydomonas incerta]|eukprot:KAG2438705.1 hypothetical protein HXX76_005251 [Chlamydomonas incerta]